MADPEIQLQSISISTPPAPSASTSAATPLDSCGYDVSEISGFELDAYNTDEGEVLDKIVEGVVKNVKKRNLDEAAQDSENTSLLEQQQQNRGKLDVLLLWCGKLQALCVSILRLFDVLLLWCGKLEALCVSISTPPAPSAYTSAAASQEDDSPAPSASTSAATPLDSCGYDVFINHRGPDVKNNFASHLYGRLLQRGLRAFLDKRELQEGQNLTLQIQRAIETATVHVAIFSPTYAQSKWCLDELLQMWVMCESGAVIIPVFYHVKPAQLRWTEGAGGVYSEDLRKLEEKKTYDTQTRQEKPRHDPDTIQKWRKVLSDVSEISGFELDANNTDEGEVLDKIVESVVKNVKKRNLDEAAQDSENTDLLEQQQQIRGKLDVLSLWCGKLHAYGLGLFGIILILKLFGIILGVAFFIFWARTFFALFNSSNFPKNSSHIPYPFAHGLGTPPGSFTVWQTSSATGQAIWWPLQLFFILFMNMTVLYIL